MKRLMTVIVLVSTLKILTPAISLAQSDQPDLEIDARTRTQVIEGALKWLNDRYVFPEVAGQMEAAIRLRMQRKEYDRITSSAALARTLTTHLREVSRDKHLEVVYSSKPIPVPSDREPTPEEVERARENLRRAGAARNFDFVKTERLEGNIGYLRVDSFFPVEVGAPTAVAAMNFLANTDALIIDLRYNSGGTEEMVQFLSSYLFTSEAVHLNDIYRRVQNETQQYWTLSYVPGNRYPGKPVYVLTSRRTFSAAESFTYNLQSLKRATIIGETTGGGANPGSYRRINDHFSVFVPRSRAINPTTKTNWEGVGVKPDIEVQAELALKTAQTAALKKLIETGTDEERKSRLRAILEILQK